MMKILWVVLGIGVMVSDVRAREIGDIVDRAARMGEYMLGRVTALGDDVIGQRQARQQGREDRLRDLSTQLQAARNPKGTWNAARSCFDSPPPVDATRVRHLQDDIGRLESEIANEQMGINALQDRVVGTVSTIAERAADVAGTVVANRLNEQRDIAIETNRAAVTAHVNNPRLERQASADRAETTKRLKYGAVGVTASALLIMGTYFGLRHYYKPRPTIIERDDTSIRTMWEKLLKVKIPASNLSSLVLDESLEALVKAKFVGIENAIKQRLPLSNMMFYGPAGTGKTMAAQEFARYLSELGLAEHVIIRGPAFKRLDSGNKAVEMLANILRWAKSSSKKGKKPVVLVFDEAETLFADREQPEFATKLTSDLVTTMTSFLGSAISTDVMFILSTNFPNRIDKALRNRIAKVNRVRFTLPGQKQREELLQLYLDQNFTDQGFTIAPAVLKNIKTYAANMEHLVGRDIQALTAQPLYTLVSQGKTELTPELLQEAIQDSMRGEDLSAY
jgi:hypothetical protein